MTSQHALRHRTTAVLAAALGTCALQAVPAAADAAADPTDAPRRAAPGRRTMRDWTASPST